MRIAGRRRRRRRRWRYPTMDVENVANVCRPEQRDSVLEASVERQSCRRHRCYRSCRESLRQPIFHRLFPKYI